MEIQVEPNNSNQITKLKFKYLEMQFLEFSKLLTLLNFLITLRKGHHSDSKLSFLNFPKKIEANCRSFLSCTAMFKCDTQNKLFD